MPAEWVATRSVPVGDLLRFPGNARRGDVHAIRRSLRRHGQYRALVVRENGGVLTILAGNHTYDALCLEKFTEARCEIIHCTDDEARRINLADNRIGELGVYDDDALAALLDNLHSDFEGTGWTAEDLDKLTRQDGLPEPGDAATEELPPLWGVIVECADETQQTGLLQQLSADGWTVRALLT